MELSKAEIVRRGHELGVDFALTVSCYNADAEGRACGSCDSCRLRHEGFAAAGIAGPHPLPSAGIANLTRSHCCGAAL